MPDVFVIIIWFGHDKQGQCSVEAVVAKDLAAAKEHISRVLENGTQLAWTDARSFSACDEIAPTKHYYTIHKVPLLVYS